MLNHFVVGPTEDQTYYVARFPRGSWVASIVYEHLGEQDALDAAERLNKAHRSETPE